MKKKRKEERVALHTVTQSNNPKKENSNLYQQNQREMFSFSSAHLKHFSYSQANQNILFLFAR